MISSPDYRNLYAYLPLKLIMRLTQTLITFIFVSLICGQDNDWLLVGTERSYSISGIANVGDRTFVVHDNKRDYEAKLGEVHFKNGSISYKMIEWPHEEQPFDLEALTRIPGSNTDMFAMESQGKCHWLVADHAKSRIAYNGFIQIPKIKWPTNLEGFGLLGSGETLLAVWGHRGKSKYPGKLFWGWMDLNKRTVTPIDSMEIIVEWPTESVRHISDLKVSESGDCWISSSSDPGDDGPFSSAVYHIGRFKIEDSQVSFYRVLSTDPALKFNTKKVEAIELIEKGILVATDDENFGGYIKTVYFK